MRTLLYLVFLILNIPILSAQGHFPLQIGNLWQMKEQYPPPYERQQWKILRDSLLPNGKTYYHFTGAITSSKLLREEGALLYAYDDQDSSEYVLFDFDAMVGDTINQGTIFSGPMILQEKDTVNYFGKYRTRWTFAETYSILFGPRRVVDSIGIQYVWVESDQNLELEGAIIDGMQYGTVTHVESTSLFPDHPTLFQNTPNPFNPSTAIRIWLPTTTRLSVSIYSITGELVSVPVDNKILHAGEHSIEWSPVNVSTGVYLCRLTTSDYTTTNKMIFLR